MCSDGQLRSRLHRLLQVDQNTRSCYHVMIVLFFYILSYTLTTVMENQFYLDKACTANLGYNKSLCDSLTDGNHTTEEVQVQKYVATFTIYNNLVRQVLPVVPGFALAAWSDARGVRAAIVIAMVGKAVYFAGYVLCARFARWPLEFVLLVAALPRALAGYDISIFMAARTHISEATPPEKLTQRLAVMETINQISGPVGLTIGSAIFTASGRNYITSFLVSTLVAAFGLFYSIVFITNFKRKRCKKVLSCENLNLSVNMRSICRKSSRTQNKALYTLLGIMFLHSMTSDVPLQFLYTQLVFRWNTQTFSNFQTIESLFSIFVSGLVPPMTRSIPDFYVLACGLCMVIISRLCFALTSHQWVMYLGAVASSFQILTYISVYSMVSKVTSLEHRGKSFVIFTSIESATSLISSPLYSYIYSATILTLPSAIFYVSVLLQSLMLGLAITLKYSTLQDTKTSNTNSGPTSTELIPSSQIVTSDCIQR